MPILSQSHPLGLVCSQDPFFNFFLPPTPVSSTLMAASLILWVACEE